jgi:hypothetical protein
MCMTWRHYAEERRVRTTVHCQRSKCPKLTGSSSCPWKFLFNARTKLSCGVRQRGRFGPTQRQVSERKDESQRNARLRVKETDPFSTFANSLCLPLPGHRILSLLKCLWCHFFALTYLPPALCAKPRNADIEASSGASSNHHDLNPGCFR